MTTTIKQHINSLPLDERADFIKDYNELQKELKQLNNMTKVSVFGQEPAEQPKELKKIEFVKCLNDDESFDDDITSSIMPSSWLNVSLITKNHNGAGMDLILAWDSGLDKKLGCPIGGTLFLGHWNDGVI